MTNERGLAFKSFTAMSDGHEAGEESSDSHKGTGKTNKITKPNVSDVVEGSSHSDSSHGSSEDLCDLFNAHFMFTTGLEREAVCSKQIGEVSPKVSVTTKRHPASHSRISRSVEKQPKGEFSSYLSVTKTSHPASYKYVSRSDPKCPRRRSIVPFHSEELTSDWSVNLKNARNQKVTPNKRARCKPGRSSNIRE